MQINNIFSFQPINEDYVALSLRQKKARFDSQFSAFTMSSRVSTRSLIEDVVREEDGSVSYTSFVMALEFVNQMPYDIATPDVSVDPDGEICLEWYKSNSEVCSITFGEQGMYYVVGVTEEERFANSTNSLHNALKKIQEVVYVEAA